MKDGPWGGANQFLKALRQIFIKLGIYEENPFMADVVLFNSHHNILEALKLKLQKPGLIFVHRVDGPVFFIRNRDKLLDKIIFKFSAEVADFTIFQSAWSLEKCRELGFKGNNIAIIHNAPDKNIFNKEGKAHFSRDRKTRIIATSWSANMNKGFETYQFIDNNLDFDKYDFIFVGNSPIRFKNIRHIPPLNSCGLARELKKSDIFMTASKNDPCSNSLIEALACGLPALVLNSGGHPELISKGGELFENNNEIIKKLEKLTNNYSEYRKNIPKYDIRDTALKYIDILRKQKGESVKKINFFQYIIFMCRFYFINFKNILNYKINKLINGNG